MRKFTESLSNITKIKGETITYFDLFPLLRGLEIERPGIKDRVWKFLCDEWDVTFKPYNGRILEINLFYYGVGEEYPLKYLKDYPEEIEDCKKTHPSAFKDYMGPGTGDQKDIDLRLDLNLIWHAYESEIKDPESFAVITQW